MSCSGELGVQTWTELNDRRCIVVVPLGSLEQHGPHLPLDTDARIAGEVTRRAAEAVAAAGPEEAGTDLVLVAPALAYGASGEHEGFAGTVSIGHEALRMVLVEYGRSACRWADRVVFVNGHGGNVATLVDAVGLLRGEGRDVAWFACAVPGDAHAGDTETSLLLHISPDLVRRESVRVGNIEPLAALMGPLRRDGVRAVSPTGVLGDPRTADAQRGRRDLDALGERLRAALLRWAPDVNGVLR